MIASEKVQEFDHKLTKAYKRLFATPDGKLVLEDLMVNVCHLLDLSRSPTDSETYFREGERNVMLYILNMIKKNQTAAAQQAVETYENYQPNP